MKGWRPEGRGRWVYSPGGTQEEWRSGVHAIVEFSNGVYNWQAFVDNIGLASGSEKGRTKAQADAEEACARLSHWHANPLPVKRFGP